MPIERNIIEFVAAADWTDDCRIRVELKKRVTTLTPSEAREFRAELDAAIAEADRGVADLLRDVEPARFDLLGQAELLSPDCRAGKHPLHQDEAWDDVADVEVPCQCPCHLISTSGRAA